MILLQAPIHNLYLHSARDNNGRPRYLIVYGLQVARWSKRLNAINAFARQLDHAEECETGHRPIFGKEQ